MIVVAVDESMSQILGKTELEEDWLLVGEEFDEADLAGVGGMRRALEGFGGIRRALEGF